MVTSEISRKYLSSRWVTVVLLSAVVFGLPASAGAQCERNISADVVALDQVFFWNRLGTVQPQGMMFALARDVVPIDPALGLVAGNVQLRADKRPRPLVLRMNVGDCLTIHFTNLLDPVRRDLEQAATRDASIHVIGLQLVTSIADDGTNVGANGAAGNGVVPPGGSATYTLHAEREGEHVLFSTAATTGGDGDGGQLPNGLFGGLNVEPRGAGWYRSQVTAADLALATAGSTPDGHPILNYEAVYPVGHPQAGTPILNMLQAGEIVHSDLTAIIAGPFGDAYPPNPVYPNRDQSFREFTIIYHDEIGAVQAFPQFFLDPVLIHTTHSVRDGFAINYGTGGIGAEIIANRLAVGPMRDCVGCKYEEFFLSAWTVGDPAEVVDIPANTCVGNPACRATQVLYPDDPSNVYHSYLQDHVKFRILHGGAKEHHIHHQHAHQWIFSPDSDESAYLDSQAIGPGASFTLEMTYNGSGNRNQTAGDSIFHCHFYPHFAQGMWALWRVHDIFEDGTRMLPDGEIVQGTPIPGLVPISGLAMAPMPGAVVTIAQDPRLPGRGGQVQINGKFVRDMTPADLAGLGNPGFPFWVPGQGGSRPPHPPLDTIDDGGLARHVLLEGEALHVETRLDFTKELEAADALEIPETGAPVEEAAMLFHEQRHHPSFTPEGVPADFLTNGLPRQPGAPFADPCIDDLGNAVGVPRLYQAANIQLDVIFNKAGWHFPQQRIITLWDDVQPTFDGVRPPEPFFFRANTNDCIEFEHTNLVPNIYELDDFQVRTPTDVLGQHIHLVKFDVLASDGAANGWNYEDGNFSPDEVRERMRAIRAHNACIGDEITGGDPRDHSFACPIAEPHPFFGAGPNGQFLGATTTVQRWFADDVLNLQGHDRTLRTVFTHDHFGPSTHQQAGLYAGLVIEPEGSTWRNPETGAILGGRFDGGPTSWRADILTGDTNGDGSDDSYREFMMEFADFQLAYQPGSHPALPFGGGPTFPLPWAGVARQPGEGFDNPPASINPPAKVEVPLPIVRQRAAICPGGVPLPCPEAISADDVGTMVANYRNEPVAMRVRDPNTNTQAAGQAGDLAFAFASLPFRADPNFNVQPGFYPPLTGGLFGEDPYTPLMRAYVNDKIQFRTLVGATEEGHNSNIHGVKWHFEPSWTDSGWRNSQMSGISEHFEFNAPAIALKNQAGPFVDHLYQVGSSTDDLWNGTWGLMRIYRNNQQNLLPLPNNPAGGPTIGNKNQFNGVCPKTAPVRALEVTAVLAQTALPGGSLVYNSRTVNGGPLHDPTAILFVRTADLDGQNQLLPGVPIEPLVLRATAGDCIELTLNNWLPFTAPDLAGWWNVPMIVDDFNANQVLPSSNVGLHPQLLALDVDTDDGANVGRNQSQLATPLGGQVKYRWYAGDLRLVNGNLVATPAEFGATGLIPADPIKHGNKGAVGALIIEPQGATWVEDAGSRAAATVTKADGSSFREFVLVFQNNINFRFGSATTLPTRIGDAGPNTTVSFAAGEAVPNTAQAEDSEDSGQKAFNYGSEPMWFRMGFAPDAPLGFTRDQIFTDVLTNAQVGGDPETPVFTAAAGTPVRFRVVHPAGSSRNNVFTIDGHIWERMPYENGSADIGTNPLSMWQGSRMGVGPTDHFDAVPIHGAGGRFGVSGDYLFRDLASFQFDGGLWGIFRVAPSGQAVTSAAPPER